MKENFVNLDVAVSVDDIIRDGASMHAVNEVSLPGNPFRAGHHRHLVSEEPCRKFDWHLITIYGCSVKEYTIFR